VYEYIKGKYMGINKDYIIIENNLGYKYRCPVSIDIPLSDISTSIYSGTYTYIYNPNYSFYLYT